MDKICSPFFTTKPLNEGTGLGLHISHGIIKNHAGRLSFESTFGQYTKVAIDLPAKGRDGYENARNK
jgi:signal transduction histidine kinase